MRPPDWIGRLQKTILNKAWSIRSRFRRTKLRLGPLSSLALLVAIAAALLVAIVATVDCYWDWLQSAGESNSATLRNIGLIIAAVIALPLALWRSWVAQRQADTAQQGVSNERYQRAAEMLGNSKLSIRLGGIYALQALAEEYPKQYHVQIMKLFCAFARRPTHDGEDGAEEGKQSDAPDESGAGIERSREDVRAVMQAIGFRSESDIGLERKDDFDLDLTGVDVRDANLRSANLSYILLRNANLSGANLNIAVLSGAGLDGADLSKANLTGANLSVATLTDAKLCSVRLEHANLFYAKLYGADLSHASFGGAKLCNAQLNNANLSGALLYYDRSEISDPTETKIPATGLTQAQLDAACADPRYPPQLDDVVLDAETGKPLVWRGGRC